MRNLDAEVAKVALGHVEGTDRLVRAVLGQSRAPKVWRPLRAVLEHELREEENRQTRVWMTHQEFQTWMEEQEILRRRRKDPVRILEAIGVGSTRRNTLLHGRDTATKVESLACAHYAQRLPLPFGPHDHEQMTKLVMGNFGAVGPLANWLHMNDDTLMAALTGFRMNVRKERVAYKIDLGVIRAVDWIVKVGPFAPYGTR